MEYQAGSRGISQKRARKEFGPGPKSMCNPKGKKKTTTIDKKLIRSDKNIDRFFIITISRFAC